MYSVRRVDKRTQAIVFKTHFVIPTLKEARIIRSAMLSGLNHAIYRVEILKRTIEVIES